jgi:Domain of unknown function (DUF4410)
MKLSLIWLCVAALLIGGCAAQPDVAIEQGVSLTKFTRVEVAPGANETGDAQNDQAAQLFRDDLANALQSEGVTPSDSGPPAQTLLVKPVLVHYEAGSAAARWIMPGAGRTQASVTASLVDKSTGKSVGDLVLSEQVTGGGLLSIGQHRLILSRLADGFAKEIAKRMRGQ